MKQIQLFDRFTVCSTESNDFVIVDNWNQELDGSPVVLSTHENETDANWRLEEMNLLLPTIEVTDTTAHVAVIIPIEDITALMDFLRCQYPNSQAVKEYDDGAVLCMSIQDVQSKE